GKYWVRTWRKTVAGNTNRSAHASAPAVAAVHNAIGSAIAIAKPPVIIVARQGDTHAAGRVRRTALHETNSAMAVANATYAATSCLNQAASPSQRPDPRRWVTPSPPR